MTGVVRAFEVELEYTAYHVLTVYAPTADAAEQAAWLQLASSNADAKNGNWRLESIEEIYE